MKYKNRETKEVIVLSEDQIETIYNMCGFYVSDLETGVIHPVSCDPDSCWYTSTAEHVDSNLFRSGSSNCFGDPEIFYNEEGIMVDVTESAYTLVVQIFWNGHNFNMRILHNDIEPTNWEYFEPNDVIIISDEDLTDKQIKEIRRQAYEMNLSEVYVERSDPDYNVYFDLEDAWLQKTSKEFAFTITEFRGRIFLHLMKENGTIS